MKEKSTRLLVIITGSSRIHRNLDSVPSIMSIMEAERESKKCRGSSQPWYFFLGWAKSSQSTLV